MSTQGALRCTQHLARRTRGPTENWPGKPGADRADSVVTKGVSENAIDELSNLASKIARPIDAVVGGQTVAHHTKDDGDPSERQDFSRDGQSEEGFASSMVPTLEEKTIFERRPSGSHANGKPLFDLMEQDEAGPEPKEAEVPGRVKEDSYIGEEPDAKTSDAPRVQGKPGDKELYGAPANAVEDDEAPPTSGKKGSDATEDEQAAVAARKTLRKHLSAKVGLSPWTMPTPTPKIDPNRFHDPLDEAFWKDMWVAVAVHNVSGCDAARCGAAAAVALLQDIRGDVTTCVGRGNADNSRRRRFSAKCSGAS